MSKRKPEVSVGMPVYNGEKYLEKSILSVLNQTYDNFELIISDNASVDKTPEICQEFALKDKRIKYYRNEINLGASKNYNSVFNLASGKNFRWQNADDIAAPELIRKCLQVIEENEDTVLCYGKTCLIDENDKNIEEYEDHLDLRSPRPSDRYIKFFQSIGLTNAIYGLMRRDAVRQTALMGNFIASDYNFMAELVLYGKFLEIPEILFYRRIHPEASSWDKNDEKKLGDFWDPLKKDTKYDRWKQNLHYFKGVKKSNIRLSEKLKLFYFLSKQVYWEKNDLWKDLFK